MSGSSDPAGLADIERLLVLEVVTPLLRVTPRTMDQSLIELGATSLQLLQMLAETEELFGVELSAMDLMDAPSVAGLAGLVDRERASAGG